MRPSKSKNEELLKQWQALAFYYGKDPAKKNSCIGAKATLHLFDSEAIRRKLARLTPADCPPIIPEQCRLNFYFLSGFTASGDKVFNRLGAVTNENRILRFKLNATADMVHIDESLYKNRLCVEIDGECYYFWIRRTGKSALVQRFGVEVPVIMRHRPVICTPFEEHGIAMALCGSDIVDNSKHVGMGFANLIERKKPVEGHAMIEVQAENLNEIVVEFFAYGGEQTEVEAITVTLECRRRSQNETYPLHSYRSDTRRSTPQPAISHPVQPPALPPRPPLPIPLSVAPSFATLSSLPPLPPLPSLPPLPTVPVRDHFSVGSGSDFSHSPPRHSPSHDLSSSDTASLGYIDPTRPVPSVPPMFDSFSDTMSVASFFLPPPTLFSDTASVVSYGPSHGGPHMGSSQFLRFSPMMPQGSNLNLPRLNEYR